MRERTTPWQSFFGDEHDDIGIEAGKGRGRIVRVEGAAIIDGADGLGRIERWAEEVVSADVSPHCEAVAHRDQRNFISHPRSSG